ncbi:hypothetical protein ACRALDRAFT_207972 [Sodiomyces alcalophilus JCM 7366]|uniref:uncharacterized protein n=1 Tax=Sodiomyces alcalophilus JCM 7366 TaxID=591952 RepID=UPI0039B39940
MPRFHLHCLFAAGSILRPDYSRVAKNVHSTAPMSTGDLGLVTSKQIIFGRERHGLMVARDSKEDEAYLTRYRPFQPHWRAMVAWAIFHRLCSDQGELSQTEKKYKYGMLSRHPENFLHPSHLTLPKPDNPLL